MYINYEFMKSLIQKNENRAIKYLNRHE